MHYAQNANSRQTEQTQPILGREQVENSAGGFVFAIDDKKRFDRFLILGCEGGTYYASERQLTVENAEVIVRLVKTDGEWAVARIVEISESGRAPKNDPALFALAVAAGLGDDTTKRAALNALPRVARTGTHLFTFLKNVQGFRGWGRGLRRSIGRWYEQDIDRLTYQLTVSSAGWLDASRCFAPRTHDSSHCSSSGTLPLGNPGKGAGRVAGAGADLYRGLPCDEGGRGRHAHRCEPGVVVGDDR